MFVLSGTVGNDPLVFIERYLRKVPFDLAKRDRDRACDMTFFKGIWTAYIHKDRRAAVERCLCFLEGYTRNFRLGKRQLLFI